MADFLATNEFPGTGAVMQVEINFAGLRPDLPGNPAPYLETDDVKAVIVTPATDISVEVQVPVDLVKVNNTTFNTDVTVVPVGQVLRVYRATDIEFPIVDFVSLQVVSESDLDNQARQVLYAVMESSDNAQLAIGSAAFASGIAVAANIASANAVELAETAVVTADSAAAAAAAAVITANAADSKSDAALAAAAAAEAHADAVEVLAAEAAQDADDAAASALGAVTTANTALSVANGIDAKAQAALDASAIAVDDAAEALLVANSIDGKAQTALDDSAAAVSIANGAEAIAVAIDGKAQTALDNSEDAIATANAAQPGDPTLTALAALVTAANKLIYSTGVDAFAQTDLTAYARTVLAAGDAATARSTLGVLNVGKGYIDGFRLVYTGRTSLTVTAGAAYVNGLGKVVELSADKVLTGISLTASALYHAYLYENAGVADIELSLTVPVRYYGTAYHKTGDTSRRYVGTVSTNASSQILGFHHDVSHGRILWIEAAPASPTFMILSGFGVTAVTSMSANGLTPKEVVICHQATFNVTGNFLTCRADTLVSPAVGGAWTQYVASGTGFQVTDAEIYVSRDPASLGIFYGRVETSGHSVTVYHKGYTFER